jgi:DNA-binding NtrC family response regulator
MELKGKTLLVHRDDQVFDELRRVLESLGLEAVRASGCKELQCRLQDAGAFLTVFTEATLPDGEYKDVCRIASRPAKALPVIVVSPFVDLDLYLDSMENGASDFIVPPFLCTDIAHVLMTAISDGLPRRLARLDTLPAAHRPPPPSAIANEGGAEEARI